MGALSRKHLKSAALFFLLLFIAFICLAAAFEETAEAYDLVVKVKSRKAAIRRNVNVAVSGGDLPGPITQITNRRGIARFNDLNEGIYSVVPDKSGFRFIPASRLVDLSGSLLTRRVTFKPRRLPAVGAIDAYPADITLRETQEEEILVTVVADNGFGIEGAPVAAASSNLAIAKVSPATARTDANGRAVFTVIGAGSIEYGMPMALASLVGNSTITFTTGGWRTTAEMSATTDVTLNRGLETELWLTSGHADSESEAFRHWDEDDPPVVSTRCAKCHSKPGYLDFIADGTVDDPAPTDTVIDCFLCHNPDAWALTEVTFPSGVMITDLNQEAICMVCHQGRSSRQDVDDEIVDAGSPGDDEIDEDIGFTNIHYYAAAATQFGMLVEGGYEYADREYDRKAPHVSAADVCFECHNPHSLALKLDDCSACHPAAVDYASVRNIRMAASTEDYDGDGNNTEGIADELSDLAVSLYAQIQAYANGLGFPIVYDLHSHPYFFNDTNGNGIGDPGEIESDNAYGHWTPRLLKAAYNYQVYQKDPGTHAHNPKYIIQLLFDSYEDLGGNTTGMTRNDKKHFDTTREAFRHWDGDGEVEADCTRCHSGEEGFLYYLNNAFTDSPDPLDPVSRFSCETCHIGTDFGNSAPRRYVSKVVFPGGTEVFNDALNPDDSFICMTCHQGRESTLTIDAAIAGMDLSFKNIHYLSAGGTLYGSLAHVGYEYTGKIYAIKFTHWGLDSAQCAYCHDLRGDRHTFDARLVTVCSGCHTEIVGNDIETIRLDRPYDYDGDGSTTEKLKDEIADLAADLYAEIQAYAIAQMLDYIVYDPDGYPYFFIDTDQDGEADPGEVNYGNRYTDWDAPLIKAAHNYQMANKEPGNWAHNTDYMAQLLIDSIEDLGGDISSYQRPAGF